MEPPPYEYGRPIAEPSLLELRRVETELALDAVASAEGNVATHAVLLGDPRSGRTSVLQEVSRRASDERSRVVVALRPAAAQVITEGAFIRHLLLAAVEAVAARYADPKPDWYVRWRERVYLRSHEPIARGDQLSSAVVLAADPQAEIDPILLEQDLRVLRDLAEGSSARGLVVTLDDAGDFTADTALVEYVLRSLGGWCFSGQREFGVDFGHQITWTDPAEGRRRAYRGSLFEACFDLLGDGSLAPAS